MQTLGGGEFQNTRCVGEPSDWDGRGGKSREPALEIDNRGEILLHLERTGGIAEARCYHKLRLIGSSEKVEIMLITEGGI